MTTTRVYIVFYSGRLMDFQTISELSGVDPSHIEVKGEQKIGHTGKMLKLQTKGGECVPLVYLHNAFIYDLPASHGKYVSRLFNQLMRAIKNPKQLGEYCKAHGIKVFVQVVLEGITDTYSVPAVHLGWKFISFLADLNNAEVDFDYYTEPWEIDDEYQP